MINPTELRKGNVINTFINTTDGKLHKRGIVHCLHMNTVEVENNETYQYNMAEPVGLNFTWLNHFGFEKYNECFWRINFRGKVIDGWYLSNDGDLTKSLSEFMIRIQYVHQLQNLYFALTNTELCLQN